MSDRFDCNDAKISLRRDGISLFSPLDSIRCMTYPLERIPRTREGK